MKIGIIGSTGLVGREILAVLETIKLPFTKINLYASNRSAGQTIRFMGQDISVIEITENAFKENDAFISSAGSEAALKWGELARKHKKLLIDNSSAWRMEKDVPLVVPEVNPDAIRDHQYIIANPNCSTIQLVMALHPLNKIYGIARVVVATYQSVSGSGKDAVDQLRSELNFEKPENPKFPHPIAYNCLPHIDSFLSNGYTREEDKMIRETSKIIGADIPLTVTCVRVPAFRGHAEAVNLELKNDFELKDIRSHWEKAAGIIVQDEPEKNIYPMPITAEKRDEVFIGRIRYDNTNPRALNFWVVADNLRKGAATNAVQILKKWMGE